MRENVGVSLPPTLRAKFLTPQVLKRCKYKKEKLVIKQGYSYAKWPQSERSYILQNFAFFPGRFVRFLQKKLMNLKRKEGANFLVRWLLFGDCCSLHRKSAIQ